MFYFFNIRNLNPGAKNKEVKRNFQYDNNKKAIKFNDLDQVTNQTRKKTNSSNFF